MGAFVLGILVGWLAEWLFFTFWVKGKSDGDCGALKDEVAILKSKLTRTENDLKAATSGGKKASATTKTAQKVTSSASSKSSTPKASSSAKVTQSKASTSTSGTKTTAKPTPAKKASAEKSTAGTSTKKQAKKSAAKKAPSKKPAVSKKASAKVSKTVGDDFTKLSGIGPSMSSTLKDLGIDTYEKLAAMDDDILRDMLEASGARLNNNKEAMDSWNEQATLAAKGNFDELKKFQEALKK